MSHSLPKSPDQILELRRAQPDMREREFARIHGITEGQLVAAHVGTSARRLNVDVASFLDHMPSLGEVMALTRNESAVHEKIGPYENVRNGANASLVLGKQIDLRIFPKKWASGYAVQKTTDSGDVRHSLQFFDAAGHAVHKVHCRAATDMAAYEALVMRLLANEQTRELEVVDALESEQDKLTGEPADREALKAHWEQMTDTHQFHGMLRKLNLTRHQAMHMAHEEHARRLDPGGVASMFDAAIAQQVPIMAFVGNAGCIQIHGGTIHNTKAMGPWINIMDETFHLHLRNDHIAELWAVRKPVAEGHVHSIEAYGADKQLIIQFFGQRVEGNDERPEWRSLVQALPGFDQSNAA